MTTTTETTPACQMPLVEASTDIQQAAAALAAATLPGSTGFVALPHDFHIHDNEDDMPTRRRARGHMNTPSVESFVQYTTAHAETGASVYVDPDCMRAVAALNMGTPAAPGHGDNTAIWKPDATAPYKALREILRNDELTQREVAEFLEDWEAHIGCAGPDGSSFTALMAAEAVRKITVEAAMKLHSTVEALSAERTTFERASASSQHGHLPTTISLTCKPYADFAERSFVLRLGVHAAEKHPRLTLRLIHEETHSQEMAQELAEIVHATFTSAAASSTEPLPIYIGTWAAGK